MSALPPSLFEALEADASLWPGPLAPEARSVLESTLGAWPIDVRSALLSAMVDPVRNDWSRAAWGGLGLAATAGAVPTGLATDDLIEMKDSRGERFGLQPLGFRLPEHAWGPPADVAKVLAALDLTFAHRRYVLYLRRPVPPGIDVTPISRAVTLWLAQVDRGDRAEMHAVYEDDDVAIDLTVIDAKAPGETGGRVLTVGPVASLERLGVVDARLTEAASQSEESIGSLPLIMALSADRSWGLSRGFVQQLLFGTPDRVCIGTEGDKSYEAEFTPNGRSLFADPACRAIAGLWWLSAKPSAALEWTSRVWDNPWTPSTLALAVSGPRFAPVGEPDRKRRVVLRWSGGS